MASKCQQPKATKHVLELAAQTVLQLERLAMFYTFTGATKDLKLLLNVGISANTRSRDMPEGPTLLHLAAGLGHTQIVLLLLRLGADKSIVTGLWGTPLHQAAGHGHVSTVKDMIKAGCPVDVVGSNGAGRIGTPLHQAALYGHVSTMKAMMKAGCPAVGEVDSNGASVLHYAAQVSNAEVVSVVLNTGCDINGTRNDGATPLHIAAANGNTETALELLRHGANKAVVAGLIGTPLHQAALRGHVSTVKELLMASCPVDVVNSNGASVLHSAAEGGNAAVIKELLTCTEIKINAANNDGATPLHVAAGSGKTEAALELIRHGANKSIHAEVHGLTTLHLAVQSQSKDCVRILLEHGADPMKVSPYFGSPYNYAEIFAPTVIEAFDNFIVEEDESLPWMHVLRDPLLSRYVPMKFFRPSFLEKDPLGMSRLEYSVVLFQFPDEVVLRMHELSLLSRHNLLLLVAIHGQCTLLPNLTHGSTIHPSFTAYTVTSLVNFNYHFGKAPQYHDLVPPDAFLKLLDVVLLSLKGRTSGKVTIKNISGDHSSLLKWLVTSDSFRHTLHEYLPNGLSPLDLAEKLGLGEAVSIIRSAGGRHGIYAMVSEEVRLQHGPAMLRAHEELMKLASSGALGQQAVQAVLSQVPGRTTVEQGTATDESHICQQKVLEQRPDLSVIITTILPKVEFCNWEETGILLQVPSSTLEQLKRNHCKLRDRYRKVLQYWLDHDKAASWKRLLEVLSQFVTKQTMDQLTQELLATQIQPISTVQSAPFHLFPAEIGATPPPPSPQLPSQFVSNVVHHVGMHWYDFALDLGISSTVLDVISFEKQGLTNDCCRKSLHRWLRHDRDTGEREREVGVVLESVMKVCGPVTVERIQSGWQSNGVRPASPTSLLLSTPELADLREFVVPFAAAQWEAVADYLQVSYEKRAAIAASERDRVEVCCRELFNQWLQQLPGTGSLPRTWEAVLDVVGEAVGTEVAKQIRTKLDSKYGAVPCLPTQRGPTVESAALLQQDTSRTAPVDPLKGELLSSKPTAVLLLKKVVPAIAQEWLQIGVHLELEVSLLKTFKATASHDLNLCCLEMFDCWLQVSRGTGESPRTWSTVLSAVRECLGQDVADGIERALLEERRQRR